MINEQTKNKISLIDILFNQDEETKDDYKNNIFSIHKKGEYEFSSNLFNKSHSDNHEIIIESKNEVNGNIKLGKNKI